MNLIRFISFGVVVFLSGTAEVYCNELLELDGAVGLLRHFDSKDWKDDELDAKDRKRIREAEEYLVKNHTALMRLVKDKEGRWVSCAYALARARNPEVAPLFIGLVRDNFYLKEADGSQKEFGFGSKNGCEVSTNGYGAVLTYHLGSIGDKRAIPVLKEAVIKGDSSVQASAYGALYRLGEFSFAELLGVVQGASDPWREIDQEVVGIIDEVRSRDSKRAIELYDRVIAELPEDSYAVANAHYWKISCYQDLKQYDRALLQCDALLKKTNFTNYTQQVPRMRAKIIKLAQEDTTLNE